MKEVSALRHIARDCIRRREYDMALSYLSKAEVISHRSCDTYSTVLCKADMLYVESEKASSRATRAKLLSQASNAYAQAARQASTGKGEIYATLWSNRYKALAAKLEGIELEHEFDFDKAKSKFKESHALYEFLEETDEVAWLDSALIQLEADKLRQLLDRVRSKEEIAKIGQSMSTLYNRALDVLSTMKRPDHESINFLTGMFYASAFLHKPSGSTWAKWAEHRESIPTRMWESDNRERSKSARNFKRLIEVLEMQEDSFMRELLEAKLNSLEAKLTRFRAMLVEKRPEVKRDKYGKLQPRDIMLGKLFGFFEDILGISVPDEIDRANQVWIEEKHGKSSNHQSLRQMKTVLISDSLDITIQEYLELISSEMG